MILTPVSTTGKAVYIDIYHSGAPVEHTWQKIPEPQRTIN